MKENGKSRAPMNRGNDVWEKYKHEKRSIYIKLYIYIEGYTAVKEIIGNKTGVPKWLLCHSCSEKASNSFRRKILLSEGIGGHKKYCKCEKLIWYIWYYVIILGGTD